MGVVDTIGLNVINAVKVNWIFYSYCKTVLFAVDTFAVHRKDITIMYSHIPYSKQVFLIHKTDEA